MGTSRASAGSPSRVPMVPPWVPEPLPEVPPDDQPPPNEDEPSQPNDHDDSGDAEPKSPAAPAPIPIAPVGRFASARRALGTFAASGGQRTMRRGVGNYVARGLGGSSTAARRFGGTARTAGALYRALGGQTPGEGAGQLDRSLLAGKSAREVIDAVIEAACPVDGTQDAEASRKSINDALSQLAERDPDADPRNLTEEQRAFVVERFVGMDVFRRFMLDVGTTIQDKAPSASTALARLKEVREYIRETVSAAFRKIRDAGQKLTGGRVGQLVQRALVAAFDVFSGYAQ